MAFKSTPPVKAGVSIFSNIAKRFDSFSGFPLLGKYLAYLNINKVHCYITWDWNFSGGFVGMPEQELIDTFKDKISLRFESGVNENWLLIVSGVAISQSIGLPSIEELREFSTANKMLEGGHFQKVYLFQYMFNRIMEWTKERGWVIIRDR